jgi:eukaryotic-like serine/threonine-protein kinase
MNRSSPAEREHPQHESHPADADTLGVGMVPACGWVSDVLQEPTQLPQHARIGPYELLGKLGSGGVATVYRARHCGDGGEDVALKLFEPAVQISQGQVALRHFFDRELRIASQLDHPHLVRILDSGMTAEGFVYLIMPLIDGMSLDNFVNHTPLDYRSLADLLAQVCDGLTYLHSRGIVHRDLKPANILVTRDGHPFVTDLGIAWQELPSVPRTMTGYVMGTPGYLSPEQLNEQVGPVSSRTDVYGLGATLYCVLMGRPPFDRGQSVASVLDVLLADPVAPRRQNRKIPRDLERICLKCLEKLPQDRYDSARALGDDLRRFAANQRVQGRPRSALTRVRRWADSHRRQAALIAAGCLLGMASVWIAVDSWQQSRSAKARSAEHLDLARQAVADASIALPQELPDSANTLKHRRSLLERGRDGFRILLDQEPDNPLLRRQAAVNLFLLGQVEYFAGRYRGLDRILQHSAGTVPGPGT